QIVAADKLPQKQRKESKEKSRLIIDARHLRFVTGKKARFPEAYKLNQAKKPKGITFGFVNDRGLYELNGDDLKLCLPTDAGTAVKAFPDKPTKGVVLLVLRRGKPLALKDLDLPNQLPKRVREILDKAEQIELLSLDPDRQAKPTDGTDFHGYKVLGK